MPGRKHGNQLMMNGQNALAVTIRPPFEVRAKAAMARSTSGASRPSIGITSTPHRWRHGLDYSELAGPGGYGGDPRRTAAPRHARRDLLE